MKRRFLKVNFSHKTAQCGFGLIEIVIGSAIFALSILGISSYYQQALQVSQKTGKFVQAGFLLEEGMEIATYYLSWNGSSWATSTTNTFIEGIFERTLIIDNVSRDSSDDIVSSGGTLDVGTKKATVSVSWNERGATTTKTISTYLTNFFN